MTVSDEGALVRIIMMAYLSVVGKTITMSL